MRFSKMAIPIAIGILALACSREMRLPTDPSAVAETQPKLTTATMGGGVQSATGHVEQASMPFTVVVVDEYSFSAIKTPNGRINGQFEFRAKFSGVVVRAHGDVECLSVNGNHARVGGRVTQSTFEAGIPVGSELTWSVTDNGEPGRGRDTASQLLGAPAEGYCGSRAQYPESTLRNGNVQVRQ